MKVQRRNQFPRLFLALSLAILYRFGTPEASAQLTWGIGGLGGTGSWDTTTADWWNGTSNVVWNSSSATFGGATAGTVTVQSGSSILATAITFNTGGYTLNGGDINFKAGNNSLVINSNANATISSTIGTGASGGTLTKNGTATLVLSGTLFYKTLQVNAGEVQTGGTGDFFFSTVNLANAAGVTVSLDGTSTTQSMGALTGGGASGGIVQGNSGGGTTTLELDGGGTFGGVLQDNGSGKLALTLLAASQTAALTGVNTYTGATTITNGALSLSGGGSALNTASITVAKNGTLFLDETAGVLSNRIGDTTPITVNGGTFLVSGNASTAVTEAVGNLSFAGAATVRVNQSGAATQLNFSGVTRVSHGTLDVPGSGGVKWTGVANSFGALIAPYVTVGNEWATVSGGNVTALSVYASSITSGNNTDDVKLTSGGTTTLSTPTIRNSLNLQNSSGSSGILDLGGGSLTLTSGGLQTSGTNASQIQNGAVKSGGSELVVINQNALTISANIGESTAGTVFTKSGTGTLTLTGTNTYSGNTAVDAGTLMVSTDSALGIGSTIEFNGGGLTAGASFSSAKGFQNGTNFAGNINTNGFNLTFTGSNNGSINKTGTGTLTETANATGTTVASAGTLALPNATSGTAILQGGTLQTAGTLSLLTFGATASTLDIGGAGASTLTTTNTNITGTNTLTVEFGIGSTSSDLWNVTNTLLGTPSFVFDVQNLGGLTTGKDYTLMNTPFSSSLTASEFALSAADASQNIAGTFKVTSGVVTLNLTSVPEPGSASLLLASLLGAGGMLRIRRSPVSSHSPRK